MTGEDDWGQEDNAAPEQPVPEAAPFTFTAHYHQTQFTLAQQTRRHKAHVVSAFSRQYGVAQVISAQRDLRQGQASRREVRLSLTRPGLKMSHSARSFRLTAEEFSPQQVTNWLIRQLRQGEQTEQQLAVRGQRVGIQLRQAGQALMDAPNTFVSPGEGRWRLTPWVLLDIPFQVLSYGGHSRYAENALRFWVTHQYVPSPEEEWHDGVREQAALFATLPPLPAYFTEQTSGVFIQQLPFQRRFLRLDFEQLPEGDYYAVTDARGRVTYSVDGRAFLATGPHGTSVANAFATLKIKALLQYPEQVEVLSAGKAFLDYCRRANITAI